MGKMKISDLSVGDWVLFTGLPRRVAIISSTCVLPHKGVLDIATFSIDDISPIPITHEILEMFGFENYSQMWYHPDSYIEFFRNNRNKDVWDRTINCGEYALYSIKYVHELQHALRLAGVEKEIEL